MRVHKAVERNVRSQGSRERERESGMRDQKALERDERSQGSKERERDQISQGNIEI